MKLKRSDVKRLEALRAENEGAELEILTATIDDLTASDPAELTIGQLLIVGELFNVLNTLGAFKRQQQADRIGSQPLGILPTERRSPVNDTAVYPGSGAYGVADESGPSAAFLAALAGDDDVPPSDFTGFGDQASDFDVPPSDRFAGDLGDIEDDDDDETDGETDDNAGEAAFLNLLQALSAANNAGPSDDDIVDTVQGPMRYGDLPKDESGMVTSEFADANCTCPSHVAKRQAREAGTDPEDYYPGIPKESAGVSDLPYGQYV